MTIPELLKEAYNRRDWAIIEEAYSVLTGSNLCNGAYAEDEYNVRTSNRFEESSVVIAPGKNTYEPPKSPDGDRKPCRTEQIDTSKNKINTYVDTKTEAIEDIQIDKKLTNRPLSPRTRGDDMVVVSCRKCGNRYKVSKSILAGKYLCDTCIRNSR